MSSNQDERNRVAVKQTVPAKTPQVSNAAKRVASRSTSRCARHPQASALWQCEPCGIDLCGACVTTLRSYNGTTVYCPRCDGLCVNISQAINFPGKRGISPEDYASVDEFAMGERRIRQYKKQVDLPEMAVLPVAARQSILNKLLEPYKHMEIVTVYDHSSAVMRSFSRGKGASEESLRKTFFGTIGIYGTVSNVISDNSDIAIMRKGYLYYRLNVRMTRDIMTMPHTRPLFR